MPYASEDGVTYGWFSIGESTARQLTDFSIEEYAYEVGAVEFEFVTSAATEAAFVTELNDCRNAFRDPREDLTITIGSTTRTYNHSTNPALDTNPRIIKDGDPADVGYSRHFRVRIEFGFPADNVATSFRRHSTVNVEYTPTRQRIVTVQAQYTANSTDGTTGAFAQYRNSINAYLTAVVAGIDSSANWETIGEPQAERNDTDKVVNITIIAQEVLHRQALGEINDDDLVDPKMDISVEDIAPGDSTGGGIGIGGAAQPEVNQTTFFTTVGNTVTSAVPSSPPGQTTTQGRPQMIRITYNVGIDNSRTKTLEGKWTNTIRPLLISEAKEVAAGGVVLLRETPLYQFYENRFQAEMEFIVYRSQIFEKRIVFDESLQTGWILKPVTDKDVFSYYEYPGPAVRIAKAISTYKQETAESDPNKIVAALIAQPSSAVTGLVPSGDWRLITRRPRSVNLLQGRPGGETPYIAEVEIWRL